MFDLHTTVDINYVISKRVQKLNCRFFGQEIVIDWDFSVLLYSLGYFAVLLADAIFFFIARFALSLLWGYFEAQR